MYKITAKQWILIMMSWLLLLLIFTAIYQAKINLLAQKEKFAFQYGLKHGLAVGLYDATYSKSVFYNVDLFKPDFANENWQNYELKKDSFWTDSSKQLNTYWIYINADGNIRLDKNMIVDNMHPFR